jgi:peptidoglycan/LPS O-acetylase OafA/YrhL
LATVCLLMRVITAHKLPYGHKTHLFPSHLRMDSLFFGVLISYLYHIYPKRFLAFAKQFRWVLVVCGIAMLAPAFIFQLETSPFISTFGLTIFYIGSGCLLVASIAMTVPDTRAFRFASYIGSHSYSIYLWHVAVAVWLIPVFSRLAGVHWPLYAVTYVVCSLSVGVAMALLIEFPTLRVRDRFFPSRGRPLSVSPVGPNPASAPVAQLCLVRTRAARKRSKASARNGGGGARRDRFSPVKR